jgi:hypothetical protein
MLNLVAIQLRWPFVPANAFGVHSGCIGYRPVGRRPWPMHATSIAALQQLTPFRPAG